MKNKIIKILTVFLLLITLTGCTKTLTDSNNKPIKYEKTGQNVTENIVCKPTDKELIKIYEKNKKDISKLPDFENLKISGEYEGLWNTLFVRPLAYIIINLSKIVGSIAISLVIITLVLRGILYPVTKKNAIQSEMMKKAQPELARLEKKYENKTDPESMSKKSQEMLTIYKKYNINPMSGCIFAFLQLPILLAFWEAIQRVPAIYEETFIGINMGITPWTAITNGNWYYIIIPALIVVTTYFSYKNNKQMQDKDNLMEKQMNMMMNFMTIFIGFMAFTLPTAIAFYWITSSLFTIIQNKLVNRSLKNGK